MKTIMVIEDDPAILDSVQMILENAGFKTDVKPNGSELMSGNYQKPDLIILDRQLPGVDGLDVCRHIRKHEENRKLPIIILSASPHIEKAALLAGANSFLEKPFEKKRLLGLIDELIIAK